MLAFITGASSGIGREMVKVLAQKGYDLIITARDEEKLFEVRNEILGNFVFKKSDEDRSEGIKREINIKILTADLTKEKEVLELYNKIKKENIDVFINNAGFGTTGEFWKTDLETELDIVKVNDIAMHILFKLILKDMIESKRDKRINKHEENETLFYEKNVRKTKNKYIKKEKYILNVASLSGFMPGPKMSVYYASKAYMLNLTRGVYKELKMAKENVNVSVLCPGPIYTNFADRAGVVFKTPNLSSEYTAKYAINNLFKKRLVIIPGFINKCAHVLAKIIPSNIVAAVVYKIQENRKPN